MLVRSRGHHGSPRQIRSVVRCFLLPIPCPPIPRSPALLAALLPRPLLPQQDPRPLRLPPLAVVRLPPLAVVRRRVPPR